MENATKALIIAGGVLILILVISLIVLSSSRISSFLDQKHEIEMTKQAMKANSKFENYNNQTIRGNELLSIMNSIVDYNNLQAGMNGYDRIIITVKMNGVSEDAFQYTGTPRNLNVIKFPNSKIENSANDESIKKITGLSAELVSESTSGINKITDTKLQQLSSNIYQIVDIEPTDNVEIEARARLLTKVLGYKVDKNETNIISAVEKAVYKYYQLTQFKRAMFKCTGVTYNEENGRVNGMTFEVVLNDDGQVEFK